MPNEETPPHEFLKKLKEKVKEATKRHEDGTSTYTKLTTNEEELASQTEKEVIKEFTKNFREKNKKEN